MKQQKSFNLRMLLIAVLALVMAFALVACNGDKKDNNENNNFTNSNVEMTEGMKQLVEDSRDDLDHMLNYFLTLSESINDNQAVNMTLGWKNKQVLDFGDTKVDLDSYVVCRVFLGTKSDGNDYHQDDPSGRIEMCIFENEEDAIEYDNAYGIDWFRNGNKLISDNTLYQQIVEIDRPTTITKFNKEQMEFIDEKLHRGADKEENFTLAQFSVTGEDTIGGMWWYNDMLSGNCRTKEAILVGFEDDERIEEDKKCLSINYTDDSYIRFDESTGLICLKLTDKQGWHVEETSDNKYEARYYYSVVPTTLTVPAKIGEYDIDSAYLEIKPYDDVPLGSVVVEKIMSEVVLLGNIEQITIPASDKAFVSLLNRFYSDTQNKALKTIYFGGTTQQWEELYGMAARGWAHIGHSPYVHDLEGEDITDYIDITFTVHCTNGDITYPKTNA